MVTIQSAMLVVLGFSIAGLMACIIAPAYRRRAARLATLDLKRTMPLTEAEIAAEKDRIRADYAIRIHKLESNLQELSLEKARQLVEINRRDARISALESDVSHLSTVNEEHENARRVLELTITDRLPKVEQRLAEAKKLLFERDREIAAITQTAQRQAIALDEATQINTQQRNDIHRLNATLTTRAARVRERGDDQKHETEIALRTEIEALSARVRDQAAMIARLQAGVADEAGKGSEMEISQLRASLGEAQRALQEAQSQVVPTANGNDAELGVLKATVQDQMLEIARLTAEVAALSANGATSSSGSGDSSIMESGARLSALQAHNAELASIILGLRAEVAASNEKLARQAEFYMEEMRKLSAGTRPVIQPPIAADIALSPPPAAKPSLAERMNAPRIATVQISSSGVPDLGNSGDPPPMNGTTTNGAETSQGATKIEGRKRQSLLQRITRLEKPVA